jgi:regulatory protein
LPGRRGRSSRPRGERERGGSPPLSPVETAIRYLAPRRRFERQVRAHLRKQGFGGAEIDEAIARLGELGYVDDAETCRAWVRDRMRFAPRGRHLIGRELRRQGVSDAVVESVVAEVLDREGEVEAARAVARKADRGGKDVPSGDPAAESARRRRLWGALARRGFDPEICREALRRHLDEEFVPGDAGEFPEVAPDLDGE